MLITCRTAGTTSQQGQVFRKGIHKQVELRKQTYKIHCIGADPSGVSKIRVLLRVLAIIRLPGPCAHPGPTLQAREYVEGVEER